MFPCAVIFGLLKFLVCSFWFVIIFLLCSLVPFSGAMSEWQELQVLYD